MASEGTPFEGILYAGLMLTEEGPRVLEFNARFGDPETQVILPRWEDDLYQILAATAGGRLADLPPFTWSDAAACGIVIAAAGYPAEPVTGFPLQDAQTTDPQALIFHGGTRRDERTNQVYSSGGRVLTVVGSGPTLAQARATAYDRARRAHFEGCWYRNDIGAKVDPRWSWLRPAAR
jgi:phosphoribosylamine--glycine ligase